MDYRCGDLSAIRTFSANPSMMSFRTLPHLANLQRLSTCGRVCRSNTTHILDAAVDILEPMRARDVFCADVMTRDIVGRSASRYVLVASFRYPAESCVKTRNTSMGFQENERTLRRRDECRSRRVILAGTFIPAPPTLSSHSIQWICTVLMTIL